jgi:hypothetical protein
MRHELKVHWATKANRYWRAYLVLPFFQILRKVPLAKGGFMWSLKVWRLEVNWHVKPERAMLPHKKGVIHDEAAYQAYKQKQIQAFEQEEIVPNHIVPKPPENHIVPPHTEHRL